MCKKGRTEQSISKRLPYIREKVKNNGTNLAHINSHLSLAKNITVDIQKNSVQFYLNNQIHHISCPAFWRFNKFYVAVLDADTYCFYNMESVQTIHYVEMQINNLTYRLYYGEVLQPIEQNIVTVTWFTQNSRYYAYLIENSSPNQIQINITDTKKLRDFIVFLSQNMNLWKMVIKQIDLVALLNALNLELFDVNYFLLSYHPDDFMSFIEVLTSSQISGWCKNQMYDDPLTIDIYRNGECLIENYQASHFRKDLLDNNIGNGCYSYHITMPINNVNDSQYDIIYLKLHGQDCIFDYIVYHSANNVQYQFNLDNINAEFIKGWCIRTNYICDIFNIDIYINDIFYLTIKNDYNRGDLYNKNISGGKGGIYCISPFQYLPNGVYKINFYVDSQNIFETLYTNKQERFRQIFPIYQYKRDTSIVIPVYNAYEELRICIDRIVQYTPSNIKVILVNDCSTDPKIGQYLKQLATSNQRFICITNKKNIGFSDSVNRGIAQVPDEHVIILNSDTRVTPGWFYSILLASQSQHNIGTVTPLSNNAGAFSAPELDPLQNQLPIYLDEIKYAKALRQESLILYPEVPTGNGFCMFISRECLNEIGNLNGVLFPLGYGEENDFCMRAKRAGYIHIIDDKCYIYHVNSASFQTKKNELMIRGRTLLDTYYPEYKYLISVFTQSHELQCIRYNARKVYQNLHNGKTIKNNILYIVSTKTGGTPQTNKDLMDEISAYSQCYLLRCDSSLIELFEHNLDNDHLIYSVKLKQHLNPFDHISYEYDTIFYNILIYLNISIIHIRHLLWHSLNLIKIAKNLDIKIVFSFHDYYMISNNLNLIDNCGNFLGDQYLKGNNDYIINLWKDTVPLYSEEWNKFWIHRSSNILSYCDIFVTTSHSAKQLILDKLQLHKRNNDFYVISHGRTFKTFYHCKYNISYGEKVRILVLGNISVSKGKNVILSLADYDKEQLFEYHILGDYNDSKHPRIITYGKYQRNELYKKVQHIKPHIGIIFSIWNETYCHTLTELWSLGIPAICLNFGTLAERNQNLSVGWLIDFSDIPAIYEQMKTIIFNYEEQAEKVKNITKLQMNELTAYNTAYMASEYYQIYQKLLYNQFNLKIYKIAVLHIADTPSAYIRLYLKTINNYQRQIMYLHLNVNEFIAAIKTNSVDAVLWNRTNLPGYLCDPVLDLLNKSTIKLIFDLDDDLLNVPDDKDSDHFYHKYRLYLEQILLKADLIFVSTAYLHQRLEKYNAHISISCNRLSKHLWLEQPAPRIKDDFIRAVYFGNKTHLEDLLLILQPLQEVARRYPNFRLNLIGITSQAQSLQEHYTFIDIIDLPTKNQYPNFVTFLKQQCAFLDFAVIPLANTEFNHSKSNLKVLESAALGLMSIISDCPAYSTLQDLPGMYKIQNTDEQWVEKICTVINKIIRNEKEDGAKARQYVLEHYLLDDDFLQQWDTEIVHTILSQPVLRA